jgi:hypothetical protein
MRHERETGPIRITDHLRNWILDQDKPKLTPFEAGLLEKYARLENWTDLSVYMNAKGEVYPEILYFMFAIKSYYNIKEANEASGKQPFDIG